VGPGAVSLEAAYYDYDTANVVLAEQGRAWSAGAGYIFPVSRGSLQPYLRFQKFAADSGIDTREQDAGVNWIIDGYKAQLGALYSRTRATRMADQSRLVVALQLQY
jgi:hypothetical protein